MNCADWVYIFRNTYVRVGIYMIDISTIKGEEVMNLRKGKATWKGLEEERGKG